MKESAFKPFIEKLQKLVQGSALLDDDAAEVARADVALKGMVAGKLYVQRCRNLSRVMALTAEKMCSVEPALTTFLELMVNVIQIEPTVTMKIQQLRCMFFASIFKNPYGFITLRKRSPCFSRAPRMANASPVAKFKIARGTGYYFPETISNKCSGEICF